VDDDAGAVDDRLQSRAEEIVDRGADVRDDLIGIQVSRGFGSQRNKLATDQREQRGSWEIGVSDLAEDSIDRWDLSQ
jgi:hypothetical protein